jgi:hypothetical protein
MSPVTRLPPPCRPWERLIAALVPTALEGDQLRHPVRLPMLPAVGLPACSGSDMLLVGTARIDRSGRVHDRNLLRALGWQAGCRLDLDAVHGMIVLAPGQAGRHVVDTRGAITLPAAARRMCGIEPGPPLVLAAAVREQVLVVHPATTLAQLLAAHYAGLVGADDVG